MPEIIVKYEDRIIEKFITEKKRITIGRTPDNDVVLDNKGVSRRHALIEFGENQTLIIDNESLNGTFLNSARVTEEMLHNNDSINIGKYLLIFHEVPEKSASPFDGDNTMILQTKKQRELIAKDQRKRDLLGTNINPLLLGESGAAFDQFSIDRNVVTIGKSSLATVRARGFFLSGIQAKITRDDEGFWIVNLGRKGKTKLNGELVDRQHLKNDDLIQVGKTVYRFIENRTR